MRINEVQIQSSVHPTDNQKRILAIIASSPTSAVADQEIATNQNMIAARDLMMKMGLITVSDSEVALTDQGAQVAVDENIIDDNGQLTKMGQAYAAPPGSTLPAEQDDNSDDLSGVDVPPVDPAQAAGARAPELTYGESFSLLKELLN